MRTNSTASTRISPSGTRRSSQEDGTKRIPQQHLHARDPRGSRRWWLLHRLGSRSLRGSAHVRKLVSRNVRADDDTEARSELSTVRLWLRWIRRSTSSAHSGGFPGISSNLDIFKGTGYVAVVMSNYGGASQRSRRDSEPGPESDLRDRGGDGDLLAVELSSTTGVSRRSRDAPVAVRSTLLRAAGASPSP